MVKKGAHLKAKADWKSIEIDPNLYADEKFQGLVCIEELQDYDIVGGKLKASSSSKRKSKDEGDNSSVLEAPPKKKKKKAKKKSQQTPKTEPEKVKENKQIVDKKPLPDMSDWNVLSVPEPVLRALAEQCFSTPTPIQKQCLPPAILYKQDIIGAAATGSGKTLAFGIPIIHHILQEKEAQKFSAQNGGTKEETERTEEDFDDDHDEEVTEKEILEDEISEREMQAVMPKQDKKPTTDGLKALILAPTRELAIQVKNHLLKAAQFTDIKIVAIVGGMSEQKQERLLKRKPEIIVATPGRFWELFENSNPHISTVSHIKHLVIDEADRMIEKGHFEELHKLFEHLDEQSAEIKKKRQTFVFSATLTLTHSGPKRKMKRKFDKNLLTVEGKLDMLVSKMGIKKNAKKIDLTEKTRTAENLSEAKIYCEHDQKDLYLYYFLSRYPGRTLVFCNSKDCVRRLVSIFTLLQCQPLPLHADMHQKQRLKNLERFSANPKGLLLATDVAARGLDIPHVEHVIHFQVPRTMENYIHRSGRTARASQSGLAVLLVCAEEQKDYRKILYSLERTEDMASFPIDLNYLPCLKGRVQLAKQLDTENHRFQKKKRHNDWYKKAAEDMDIELDEDELLDLGDTKEQANHHQRISSMREELNAMLGYKVSSKKFMTKYPTKMGKLQLPAEEKVSLGALKDLKEEKYLLKKKGQKSKVLDLVIVKKKKTLEKKKKKFQKRKEKKMKNADSSNISD